MSKKYMRHISPATESRQMEGGIAVFVLKAGICAVFKKKLHHSHMTPLRGVVKRSSPTQMSRVWVGAVFKKKLHHSHMTPLRGEVEGRVAVVVLCVGVCAVFKKKLHNL
jgi:hypothetical protein